MSTTAIKIGDCVSVEGDSSKVNWTVQWIYQRTQEAELIDERLKGRPEGSAPLSTLTLVSSEKR